MQLRKKLITMLHYFIVTNILITDNVTTPVQKHLPYSQNIAVVDYYIIQVQKCLMELKCGRGRRH